ncbi:MAG: TIGR03986 family CRISPR-associated RAMP protein [Deltaproteobacteria bacterium]|nr:TIGR03986 family CRISPR-associated RAMP protein [Deltaproteobacteria bacterium]
MALERGKLVLSKKGKPQIEANGKLFNPAQGELSRTIVERLKDLRGTEVEFEMVEGQPKKIREVGSEFIPHQGTAPRRSTSRTTQASRHPEPHTAGSSTARSPDFHNPYNFIPAPPRKLDDPDLGDHEPVSQDRFHSDRYTGRIRVTMEAVTPLLVPDAEDCREESNGHKTFPVLLGKDGKPLIPSSSVRGMLRAAYEVVTNSRFGRFSKEHQNRPAYRMEAREGLRLIPARIENGQIHLLTGTSSVNEDGSPNGPQYAAWLPRYSGANKNTSRALTYTDGTLPQHGEELECWVELMQHHRWDKEKDQHIPDFQYWAVRSIVKAGGTLPSVCPSSQAVQKQNGRSWHEPQSRREKIHGWVCVTNANINRKHDERVFFCDASSKPPGPFPLTDSHKDMWRELIGNYREIHTDDLERRRRNGQGFDAYLGREPGKTAWSRHVYDPDALELRDGTLCYVRLNPQHTDVEALFPVMIARELYQASPWELLDPSLRPATKLSELSPADRVFGWVRTEADGASGSKGEESAVRGLLRVGPVVCESSAEDALEYFNEPGLPLAILAAPKPQQGRFYVAASSQGKAQNDGLSKAQASYAPGKGLRGRKVYPHHQRLPREHWANPLEDRTQNRQGPWQEYRRPSQNGQEQRDDQNRSVLGWVKPGARFSFDIHVTNLSKVELGALLYLLTLPQGYCHRFGGGKPLGFGSVRLAIESCEVQKVESLHGQYRSWEAQAGTENIIEEAVNAFKEAVRRAYGSGSRNDFDEIPFIRAVNRACCGFDDGLPLHYPRATPNGQPGPPSPMGEAFKWFVANERGVKHALRDLATDAGLPTLQET